MAKKIGTLDEMLNLAFVNESRTEMTLPLSVTPDIGYVFYASFKVETGRSFRVRQISAEDFRKTYNIPANSEDLSKVKPGTPLYNKLVEKNLVYPAKPGKERVLVTA